MKQLIFVVETNSETLSDDRYLKVLIQSRYSLCNNDIKIQYVHMCGKGNYKSKKIESKIKNFIRNNDGENTVIYCFDTDHIDQSPFDLDNFTNQKQYCEMKGYYLIWFNYDIEYVLLGKSINDNKKKDESIRYFKKNNTDIPINKLMSNNFMLNVIVISIQF